MWNRIYKMQNIHTPVLKESACGSSKLRIYFCPYMLELSFFHSILFILVECQCCMWYALHATRCEMVICVYIYIPVSGIQCIFCITTTNFFWNNLVKLHISLSYVVDHLLFSLNSWVCQIVQIRLMYKDSIYISSTVDRTAVTMSLFLSIVRGIWSITFRNSEEVSWTSNIQQHYARPQSMIHPSLTLFTPTQTNVWDNISQYLQMFGLGACGVCFWYYVFRFTFFSIERPS